MQDFSRKFLGFTRNKGVDFLAKFNDALSTLHSFTASEFHVIPIAIIDGVIYIRNRSKMHKYLHNHPEDNIMSALILREFLYSL